MTLVFYASPQSIDWVASRSWVFTSLHARTIERYHLFGETVTTAEQMESSGVEGGVTISQATMESLSRADVINGTKYCRDRYSFQPQIPPQGGCGEGWIRRSVVSFKNEDDCKRFHFLLQRIFLEVFVLLMGIPAPSLLPPLPLRRRTGRVVSHRQLSRDEVQAPVAGPWAGHPQPSCRRKIIVNGTTIDASKTRPR